METLSEIEVINVPIRQSQSMRIIKNGTKNAENWA
jgi:hypothetical protein